MGAQIRVFGQEHIEVTGVDGELVSMRTTVRLPDAGDEFVVGGRLRFMPESDLRDHLHRAGFGDVTIYCDLDSSPVSAASPELIVVALPA
jgi:hypothetical protein